MFLSKFRLRFFFLCTFILSALSLGTVLNAATTIALGKSVTLSISVQGTAPFTYQWYKNGVAISGARSSTYVIGNMQAINAGAYHSVVSNAAGSTTSSQVSLVTLSPIVFTSQPANKTVAAGSSVTFSAAASGLPLPTYQWRKNGVNISGATASSYSITKVTTSNAGLYSVIATNSLGSATSNNATLTVASAPTVAPAFTKQPVGQTTNAGSSVTFTSAASGSPSPAYQWRKNGVNIGGATSSSYILTGIASGNTGTYSVVATNSAGSAVSNGAVLTVNSSAPAPGAGADFSGDGRSDILWENVLTGQHLIWVMNGTTYSTNVSLGTQTTDWMIVGIGDFNGDRRPDILWENSVTGHYGVRLMNGTSLASWIDLGVEPAGWKIESVGDFNGDGQADIIWRNTATAERAIRLMKGTVTGSFVSLGWVDPEWHVAGTADFDGDGKTDILWNNENQAQFGLWVMNGTVYSRWLDLGAIPTDWRIGGTGDFNGDGHPDILWQKTKSGECRVWLMNGVSVISNAPLRDASPEWLMVN